MFNPQSPKKEKETEYQRPSVYQLQNMGESCIILQ